MTMNYDLKVALNLLVPGTGFVEDDFCIGEVEGIVLGWFWCIAFIVHFVSIVIMWALPQIIRR